MDASDADLALLASLVGDVDAFARDVWGRRPLHRRDAGCFDGWLSVQGVEDLLASAARRPTFRLVQDGVTLPASASTRAVRMAGAELDDVADVGRIAAAVDSGATLVLQGLQRTSLPLAQRCRSLERATSHPVQANAYLTPAGAAGLAEHADDHDVLVLQVDGSKTWTVEGLGPLVVSAGDVLYLPVGTRHSAAAQEGMSLHLTIGILRVTWGDVVRRALAGCEALAQPLPLGFAREEGVVASGLRSTLQAVASHLSAVDGDALAADEARRARTRRLPLPLGQLSSVLALPDLSLDDVVERRSDHVATIADGEPGGDGRFVLSLVDRTLHLPPVARGAVEQLLAAVGPLCVGDLVGLDEESRLVLARRLVREGLVRVVSRGGGG